MTKLKISLKKVEENKTSIHTTLSCFEDNPLWGYHFPIEKSDISFLIHTPANRRVLCTINGHHTYHAALMPNKGSYFIMINKSLVKKLKLSKGQNVTLDIQRDVSTFGMDMPTELQEVVNSDPVFNQFFQALTPGKQRNLIYIVSKVKNSTLRINKSLIISEHIIKMHGKIDFKILNNDLKIDRK